LKVWIFFCFDNDFLSKSTWPFCVKQTYERFGSAVFLIEVENMKIRHIKRVNIKCKKIIQFELWIVYKNVYTANILTVLSTAFGSVTFPTVIWLHILQPNIALSLKLYSSKSVTVMCTANGCDNPSQITVGNVTQQMAVNWL